MCQGGGYIDLWLGSYTMNMERFAGLKFCGFCSFQEYYESFSMNLSASLKLYQIIITSGQDKAKKYFHENFNRVETANVYIAQ